MRLNITDVQRCGASTDDAPRQRGIRLNIGDVPHVPAAGFMVLVALAPRLPSVADLQAPGGLSALLSHDAGVSWPDRRGVSLMQAVLAEAGTVALVFETAADADGCRARLAAENRA